MCVCVTNACRERERERETDIKHPLGSSTSPTVSISFLVRSLDMSQITLNMPVGGGFNMEVVTRTHEPMFSSSVSKIDMFALHKPQIPPPNDLVSTSLLMRASEEVDDDMEGETWDIAASVTRTEVTGRVIVKGIGKGKGKAVGKLDASAPVVPNLNID